MNPIHNHSVLLSFLDEATRRPLDPTWDSNSIRRAITEARPSETLWRVLVEKYRLSSLAVVAGLIWALADDAELEQPSSDPELVLQLARISDSQVLQDLVAKALRSWLSYLPDRVPVAEVIKLATRGLKYRGDSAESVRLSWLGVLDELCSGGLEVQRTVKLGRLRKEHLQELQEALGVIRFKEDPTLGVYLDEIQVCIDRAILELNG